MSDLGYSTQERMARLSRRGGAREHSARYTNFVRIMRFALPISALLMIGAVFIGARMQDRIVPENEPVDNQRSLSGNDVTRNELINPTFESIDKKSQPYRIIAERAVQGEKNKDLIMLEQPRGEMTMEDGALAKMRSLSGAYRQDTERFYLQGAVRLEHSDGYTFESEELHIDMQKNYTWSEVSVRGEGPDMEIEAEGMRANGKTNEVVLLGPAKVILYQSGKGNIK